MSPRVLSAIFVIVALLGVHLQAEQAEAVECDALLEVVDDNPLAYRQRGDRCEGIYVRGVAASPLRVRSLTRSFSPFDAGNGKPLRIRWPRSALPGTTLRLRADALRRRLYYRMDTAQAIDRGEYRWPSGLLASLGIERPGLGLVGTATREAAGATRTLYVPLDVAQDRTRPRDARCELVLWPEVELSEVYLTLWRSRGDGKAGEVVLDGIPLAYGYYPAERPIRVLRPELCAAGVHHLEVGAELRGRGTATLDIWIASPGD